MQAWEDHYRSRAASESQLFQSGRAPNYPPAQLLRGIGEIARLLQLSPDQTLLDVGCGNGLLDIALNWFCGRILAVEPVPELAALARENLQGYSDVQVLDGHCGALPVANGCADRALLNAVLQLLSPEEAAAALAEIYRALRPGGRVLLGGVPDARRRDEFRTTLALRLDGLPNSPPQEREAILILNEASTWYSPEWLAGQWAQAAGRAQCWASPADDGIPRFNLVIQA